MGITLDGELDPNGQIVESIHFAGSPGYERQVNALAGWDSVDEKVAVKNLDPGNGAYGVTVRTLPRRTENVPNVAGRYAAGTTAAAIAANANRLSYSVENDNTGGEGLVYVMEGAGASATVWVARLQGGERWSPEVWSGKVISVYVTASAVAHCVEWVP